MSIAVELPKAKSGATDGKEPPLVITVDAAGTRYLEQKPVSDREIRERAREASTRDPGASAVLAADARARHASVVHVLDLLRGERVAKIAIVVRGGGDDEQ